MSGSLRFTAFIILDPDANRRSNPLYFQVNECAIPVSTAKAGGEGFPQNHQSRSRTVARDPAAHQANLDLAAGYGAALEVNLSTHDTELCRATGGELERIQLLLGHASIQTTERYLRTRKGPAHAPDDRFSRSWRVELHG
jgi:hypothetical protein